MTGGPSAATQRGTVLAAVKATPCGWPAASLDPSCGRQPPNAVETRARRTSPRPRSVNLRSPRFRGMATHEPGVGALVGEQTLQGQDGFGPPPGGREGGGADQLEPVLACEEFRVSATSQAEVDVV